MCISQIETNNGFKTVFKTNILALQNQHLFNTSINLDKYRSKKFQF